MGGRRVDPGEMGRPNLLVLCVDALRVFECLDDGDRGAVMDGYDAVVDAGVEFSQMVAASTTTTPCMASIHTGEYPFVHGAESLTGPKIRDEVPLVTERLSEAGYDTAALVNRPMSDALGFDRGYADYDLIAYADEIGGRDDWFGRIAGHIEELEPPWFYFVHFPEVHLPREVAPEMDGSRYGRNRYERSISTVDRTIDRVLDRVDLDETAVVYTADHGESIAGDRFESVFEMGNPLKFLTKLRYQYGLGGGLDWLERRLDVLRDRGIHEHDRFTTLDHGFYPYECLVRVPFAVAGPGVEARDRVDEQVRQIDVAPTLLDCAGVDGFDCGGRSVLPVAAGDGEPRDAYMMANGPVHWDNEPFEGVRTPRWKYVLAGDDRALYDLDADPVELRNVVEAHGDVADQLDDRLDAIRRGGEAMEEAEQLGDDERAAVEESLRELGYI